MVLSPVTLPLLGALVVGRTSLSEPAGRAKHNQLLSHITLYSQINKVVGNSKFSYGTTAGDNYVALTTTCNLSMTSSKITV